MKIYNFTGDIEVTYKSDGVLYGADGPYGPSNDELLHKILESKQIEYTILEKEYEGDIPTTMKYAQYGSFVLMAVPLIMIMIIFIQAKTIKNLSSKLPKAESKIETS